MKTGLRYTKNGQLDNFNKLYEKFENDFKYGQKYWPDYGVIYMFWSPIIKSAKPSSKYNKMNDLKNLNDEFKQKYGDYGHIELIINEKYLDCLQALQKIASEKTEAMSTTIMRVLQIYEKTKKHVSKLDKSR